MAQTTAAASQPTDRIKVVRIVCRGQTPKDARAQERLLLEVFGPRWPTGLCTKFVITPGGFVHGDWLKSWQGRSGWESGVSDIEPLFRDAERQLARVVTDRVFQAASGKADVLTIGIDLAAPPVEHAELVAVFDITKRSIVRWTGKSYPTGSQEHALVRVTDLDSHLVEMAGERALILGCHDLNMYSPRGRATQSPHGPRRAVCDDMKRRVARFKPSIALQHPHSTDSPNIWRTPWLALAREVPSVRTWASGIAHYSWTGKVRSDLGRVLDSTRSASDDVHDIIVGVGARPSR